MERQYLPRSSPTSRFPPRTNLPYHLPYSRDRTVFGKTPGQGGGGCQDEQARRVQAVGSGGVSPRPREIPKSGTGGHPLSYGRSPKVEREVAAAQPEVAPRGAQGRLGRRGRIVPNAEVVTSRTIVKSTDDSAKVADDRALRWLLPWRCQARPDPGRRPARGRAGVPVQ